MRDTISIDRERLAEFCQQYHIRKMSVFGSVLRADFRSDSDIDLLVEFEDGVKITLFDLGKMQVELSALLGREVDLKTDGFLSQPVRQRVM